MLNKNAKKLLIAKRAINNYQQIINKQDIKNENY